MREKRPTGAVPEGGVSPADIPAAGIPLAQPAGFTDEPPSTGSTSSPQASSGQTIETAENPDKIGTANSAVSAVNTAPKRTRSEAQGPFRQFSLLQKALIAAVLVSATLFTWSIVNFPSHSQSPLQAKAESRLAGETATIETNQPPAEQEKQDLTPIQPITPQAEPTQPASPARLDEASSQGRTEQGEPASLRVADGYFTEKNYNGAYDTYQRLYQNLTGRDYELIRDFLQLRMAICLENKGDYDRANQMFRTVAESRSVSLKLLANYHSSLMELRLGQYLNARTRAYKAIALTGVLTFDYDWAPALERDCTFLIAEAITRQVLLLCDADKELPQQLWSRPQENDPLFGLDEEQLQRVLNAGIEQLNKGLLSPQIRAVDKTKGDAALNRWSVVCNGPGIDELMARFAANAGLDLRWIRDSNDIKFTSEHGETMGESRQAGTANPAVSTVKQPLKSGTGWNRSVTLCLPSATTQQVTVTAAGTVGLLAELDDTGTITITDPTQYASLTQHTQQLNNHAIWLWRKLLMMFSGDTRIANAHFALGVLQGRAGQAAEAMAEYKLVANRYSQTAMAPYALLRSSRLKTALRDYTGASRDLKELIDQYPDNELVGQAHLDLADTTMQAGNFDQARTLYKKAYNLGYTSESTAVAALGAGKCCYLLKDYQSAIKWLTRYLYATRNKTQDKSGQYSAYLLLGKANLALGNLDAACAALQRTVATAAASDDYIDAITALVDTQIKQENFVAALATVENVRSWPFSQEQVSQLMLLKSRALREMGLIDQAVTILAERQNYITDSHLKAGILTELARCHIAGKNLDLAREYLTEVLALVEPGPLAQQASVELADVAFKLGDNQQTITLCNQLLESSADEQTKQRASKMLAAIYSKQQEYDKAAMALISNPVAQEQVK